MSNAKYKQTWHRTLDVGFVLTVVRDCESNQPCSHVSAWDALPKGRLGWGRGVPAGFVAGFGVRADAAKGSRVKFGQTTSNKQVSRHKNLTAKITYGTFNRPHECRKTVSP